MWSTVTEGLSVVTQLGNYLSSTLPSGKDPTEILVAYSGISKKSISRLQEGGQVRGGEVFTKLVGFLATVGFIPFEYSERDDFFKGLVTMLGFEIVTFDEVIFGADLSRDSLVRYLNGDRPLRPERMEQVSQLLDGKKTMLRNALKSLSLDTGIDSIEKMIPPGSVELSVTPPIHKSNGTVSHEDVLQVAASQIQALLPLAKAIESDSFSDDERREFRDLIPDGNLFSLSNVLNRLCSRTARNQHQTEEGGE